MPKTSFLVFVLIRLIANRKLFEKFTCVGKFVVRTAFDGVWCYYFVVISHLLRHTSVVLLLCRGVVLCARESVSIVIYVAIYCTSECRSSPTVNSSALCTSIYFQNLQILKDFLELFLQIFLTLHRSYVRVCHFILRQICETIEYSRIFFSKAG